MFMVQAVETPAGGDLPHILRCYNSNMDIRLVKREEVKDDSLVDIVRIEEVKTRTSIAKLKEKKEYLETNIANWQRELVEVESLINQVNETVSK